MTIDSTTGAYTRNVEYYALAHASKFIRPGARRITSESGDTTLKSVAFRNADDGSKVLIVLNSGNRDQRFRVRSGGSGFQYALPAGAVVTFLPGAVELQR